MYVIILNKKYSFYTQSSLRLANILLISLCSRYIFFLIYSFKNDISLKDLRVLAFSGEGAMQVVFQFNYLASVGLRSRLQSTQGCQPQLLYFQDQQFPSATRSKFSGQPQPQITYLSLGLKVSSSFLNPVYFIIFLEGTLYILFIGNLFQFTQHFQMIIGGVFLGDLVYHISQIRSLLSLYFIIHYFIFYLWLGICLCREPT